MAIAAIWSNRRDPAGGPSLATVALLTTEARGAAAAVHDRMPVLVTDDLLGDWLDPGGRAGVDLLALLAERSPTLAVTRVSRRVNDVRSLARVATGGAAVTDLRGEHRPS
jgi:putative SOS response-associated peptidase YedK